MKQIISVLIVVMLSLTVGFAAESVPIGVTSVEPDPAAPVAVYLVEEPVISPMSAMGSVYPGTMSNTYTTFFKGIVAQLGHKSKYLAFRSDRYTYMLVYGDDLSASGYNFSAPAVSTVVYNTDTSVVTYGSDTNFSINVSGGFVYSNVEGGFIYPILMEGVTKNDFTALLVLVAVGLVTMWVKWIL